MVSIIPSQLITKLTSPNLKISSETDNGPSEMYDEKKRLDSFVNWNVPFISKKSLSEDGFYYFGQADLVKCAFCHIDIGCWEEGDSPNAEHKRWSPNCPFLKGLRQNSVGNSSAQGTDTCGYGTDDKTGLDELGVSPSVLSNLGVETQVKPSCTKYALLDKRLETFKDWPVSLKQKPKDLAEAGFYYNGVGDQTICFYCGIGLKDWQENDDTWEEHALWSPKCVYLRLKKGLEFVNKVSCSKAVLNASNLENSKACSGLNISVTKPKVEETESKLATKESPNETTITAPLCGICYVNDRSILYLPCRHMIACVDCGSSATRCPVCRQEVKAIVKAFLS